MLSFLLPSPLRRWLLTAALAGLVAAPMVPAAAPAGVSPPTATTDAPHPVQARLLAETTAWLAGGDTTVALELVPQPGWHTYWLNPGDSGTATSLAWTLPTGASAGPIQWPLPEAIATGGLVNYGYSGRTLHLVGLSLPATAGTAAAAAVTVKAVARWLACLEVCIPGSAELSLTLPTAASADLDPANAAVFEAARERLPTAALADWSARFAASDDDFSLSVTGSGLPAAGVVTFFPAAGDVVDHAAPQRVAFDAPAAGGASGLRLSQAGSSYRSTSAKQVEGLLVATSADGSRVGHSIVAVPGTVATVPVSTATTTSAASAATEVAKGATGVRPAAIEPVAPPSEGALGLPLALAFALLGGLVLNLMPCVFPVLSLKAYSVMQMQAGHASPGAQRAQALAYAAGAVASCVAAAAVLLALRAGGEALGWGFQLQSPVFVAAMLYLLLALALAMSGVIELGTGLMGAGSKLAERQGLSGSFFTGVLAVVVASPCTAPFMGSALGFAITQPVPAALAVFAVLGLGLALPFLLLGFVPVLAAKLPRPGAWMNTFKQLMAFPLYLTCAWLAWVLTRQAGADALGVAGLGLVVVAFAVWLWGRPNRAPFATGLAAAAGALAVATLFAPVFSSAPVSAVQGAAVSGASPVEGEHQPWSAERVAALRGEGRTVFVNFTADWCLTCKVNERGALKTAAVAEAMAKHEVTWLTGDWTRADPAITAELARHARNGVPLYLVYRKGEEPQVLPQVLTPQTVVAALAGEP